MVEFTPPTSDALTSDVESATGEPGIAVLEHEAAPFAAETQAGGPCCEKCHAPLTSDVVAICRQCGWYPSLSIFVEVDPEWETALDDTTPVKRRANPSLLQVWSSLIPRWGWIMIGSALLVVAESVAGRLVTTEGSMLRTKWSIGQLLIGVIAALGCHLFNFLLQVADNADTGMLDIVLKPLRLWTRTCQGLPRRQWLVTAPLCGIVALIMSFAVIGGIPYDRLWDWGFKQPPKQNLMGAVMDRVKELDNENGADSLEDAVKDFAGSQTPDDDTVIKPAPRQNSDCVVLGYQLDRDGKLSWLVLGTVYRGQLAFAGRVAPQLSEAERLELTQALQLLKMDRPLIKIDNVSAVWVSPKFTCRVSSTEQRGDGRLKDLEWEQMLGTMELKK